MCQPKPCKVNRKIRPCNSVFLRLDLLGMCITRIGGRILPLCLMERSTLLMGMLFISSFFLIIMLWNETSYPRFKPWNETSYPRFKPWFRSNRTEIVSERTCFSNDTKIILFHTPFFGEKPWPATKSTEEYLSRCPTKKCKITYDYTIKEKVI